MILMKQQIEEDEENMHLDAEEIKIMARHAVIARKICLVIAGQFSHLNFDFILLILIF